MRRALVCLKYLPALLCGLVVAGWIAGWYGRPRIACPLPIRAHPARAVSLRFVNSSAHFVFSLDPAEYDREFWITLKPQSTNPLGFHQPNLIYNGDDGSIVHASLYLPIPLLLTVLVPVSWGALTSFRFPLWSYFLWTALLAVQFAYYFR